MGVVPDRVVEARRLRAEGATVREIAELLGAARSTVAQWLDPSHQVKQQARRARYQGSCQVCGAPTDGSNGPAGAPAFCRDHYPNPQTAARATRGPVIAAAVALLTERPLRPRELRDLLGVTTGRAHNLLYRLRRYGLAERLPDGTYRAVSGR